MNPPAPDPPSTELSGLELRYSVDLERLGHGPFLQLGRDAGLDAYLKRARSARHGRMLTWLHRALRGWLSDFDINGLLGIYPMHVLSTDQWAELLGPTARNDGRFGTLLDIGAGRGDVTAELASLFDKVSVTETSRAMAWRLRRLGYETWEGDLAEGLPIQPGFDVVSLLNVLDRCDQPMKLLATARQLVKPGGLLVVALVLPYEPLVYDGGMSRRPREVLPIASRDFEDAAREFIGGALLPMGLELVQVSRAPYLSGGDAHAPFYELDDLLVVARASPEVIFL